MLVMLANKHTRNVHLSSAPSDHTARGVLAQHALARTPLLLSMMKPYPSVNGHWDPKQADRNNSGQLALSPQVLICPPPLLGHHPMVTSLLDRSKVIIQPMKDGNGKRTLELGPIVTMSCHRWDSNAKDKTHQIPPNKTLPFLVCLASKPRGTQWSEELFREPSQTKEPPIPCPSPSSQPPEDILTCEPEPEVAPTQSTEEPFACPSTPCSIIIIDNTPIGYPSHSHNDPCQEFTDLQPTLLITQAIVHEAINRILLEHRRLLHMIPFADATHRNEMHWDLREELNSLLAQALQAYPKEDITGIISKFLEK
ncbi:hypothetical protein O181_065831 [Austropuccinia psidii MF-1]|uniref:Uncharacterized protein n=1 Tax=Austropuccinia psidii MF-1 TaxID=1389203 RepID=A0A9Q3EWD8_9BASI|nr:hypothetical protein [Austropuccinia psidii MF-1]